MLAGGGEALELLPALGGKTFAVGFEECLGDLLIEVDEELAEEGARRLDCAEGEAPFEGVHLDLCRPLGGDDRRRLVARVSKGHLSSPRGSVRALPSTPPVTLLRL